MKFHFCVATLLLTFADVAFCGIMIDTTSTDPIMPPPPLPPITKCQKERSQRMFTECESNGKYKAQQCDDMFCWCVDQMTGEMDTKSRTPKSNDWVDLSFTCPDTRGKCLRQRHKAMDPRIADMFVPDCEEDGIYYKTKQCYGFTDMCWCVDRMTGIRVDRTTMPRYLFNLNCGMKITECQKSIADHVKNGPLAPGSYIPQCDVVGMFKRKQCNKGFGPIGTGKCWCVDPFTGKKEMGSDTLDSFDLACPDKRSHCVRKLQNTVMMPGAYIPQCDEHGLYHAEQIHASSNYKFCVDVNDGTKIIGTEKFATGFDFNCREPITKCQKARVKDMRVQCASNGKYEAQQCDQFNCWCVDEMTGAEDAASKTPRGNEWVDLSFSCPDTRGKCKKQRQKALNPRIMDGFAPECEDDGIHYKGRQCYGFLGTCSCVNRVTGDVIPRTTMPQSKFNIDCTKGATECQMREADMYGDNGMMVLHPPNEIMTECDAKTGLFKPKQCSGETCWCVDINTGAKDEDSETPNAPNIKFECPDKRGKCLRAKHKAQDPRIADMFVPECEDGGKYYKSKQCYNLFTSTCWCVDRATGARVDATTMPMQEFDINCDKGMTHCQRTRQKTPDMPGAFKPQCAANGLYKPKQFYASSGYMSCVNVNDGVIILGTNVFGLDFNFDCSSDITKCQKQRANGNPVECASNGGFKKQQCDEYYCWCVDEETGVKDNESETPRGDNRADLLFTCPDTRGKCKKERQKALDPRIMDNFAPECEADGIYYKPKQCYGFLGTCYCVDKVSGHTIPGTTMRRHDFDIDCTKSSPARGCDKPLFEDGLIVGQAGEYFVKFNTMARFRCNYGFRLKGKRSSYCKRNGSFSNPIPICVRV